jgi:hypothetical protein
MMTPIDPREQATQKTTFTSLELEVEVEVAVAILAMMTHTRTIEQTTQNHIYVT